MRWCEIANGEINWSVEGMKVLMQGAVKMRHLIIVSFLICDGVAMRATVTKVGR